MVIADPVRNSGRAVLIVADAAPRSGLGHIARCSAIAAGLEARGIPCRRLAVGADQPPHSSLGWECLPSADGLAPDFPAVLLVDSYHIDPVAIRARTGALRLVVTHDAGPVTEAADLVISSDPGLAGTQSRIVGGPAMTCLGPRYWGLPAPRPAPERIRRALVSTGGGDPRGDAVEIALAVASGLPDADVMLVRGPYARFDVPPGISVLTCPESLLAALMAADLAVTGAGASLHEALAVGTPTLALVMAANQRARAQYLAARGTTRLVTPGQYADITAAVAELDRDQVARQSCAEAGRRLIDGYGALRVAFLIGRLVDGLSLGSAALEEPFMPVSG